MRKAMFIFLMSICTVMCMNAVTIVNNEMSNNNGVSVISEMEETEVIYGTLLPGNEIYPVGVEFEFVQGTFTSENYTYEWKVLDEYDFNVMGDGSVTFSTKELPVHMARISFQRTGIFVVTLEVYNEDKDLVGVFTAQAIVV